MAVPLFLVYSVTWHRLVLKIILCMIGQEIPSWLWNTVYLSGQDRCISVLACSVLKLSKAPRLTEEKFGSADWRADQEKTSFSGERCSRDLWTKSSQWIPFSRAERREMSLLEICRWWSGHPPRTLPNVRVDIQFFTDAAFGRRISLAAIKC